MATPRRRWSAGLVAAGLAATGIGFAGAGIDAGQGPRTVHGSLTLGPLYLPPLLVALAAVTLAALAVTRIRRAAAAAILLAGSATFGAAAISYRLGHPAAAIPFAEDTLQLLGEAIATGAGIAATMRLLHRRKTPGSHTGQAGARQTAGPPRTMPGAPRRSHQPDGVRPGRRPCARSPRSARPSRFQRQQ